MKTYNKNILIFLLVFALLFLNSCSLNNREHKEYAGELPEIAVINQQLLGDENTKYFRNIRLFLPDKYTYKLNALNTVLEFSLSENEEKSLINYLLEFEGNEDFAPINYNNKIGLYGENPVEISDNLISVNLTANALSLDREQLYLLSSAIAQTIMDFSYVEYVNILVADKAISLDLFGHLPLGTIEKQRDNDPYSSYIKLFEFRDNADKTQRISEIPVSLYYPSGLGFGILPEVRLLSFNSFDKVEIISKILKELDNGPRILINNVKFPSFYDMLFSEPSVSEALEGGNLISLKFKSVFEDVLQASDINLNTAMAMLSHSICSFYPDTIGLKVYIGDKSLDILDKDYILKEKLELKNGIISRKALSVYLQKSIRLYFVDDTKTKLVECRRLIPQNENIDIRKTIAELAKGPLEWDFGETNLNTSIPFEINDEDILGIKLEDGNLIINFSSRIKDEIHKLNKTEEKLLVYSFVNTLCDSNRIKSLSFLFQGDAEANIAGDIYWKGMFFPSLKIINR